MFYIFSTYLLPFDGGAPPQSVKLLLNVEEEALPLIVWTLQCPWSAAPSVSATERDSASQCPPAVRVSHSDRPGPSGHLKELDLGKNDRITSRENI